MDVNMLSNQIIRFERKRFQTFYDPRIDYFSIPSVLFLQDYFILRIDEYLIAPSIIFSSATYYKIG